MVFTSTVVKVTENDFRNRLKIGKLSFYTKFETFDRDVNMEYIYFSRQ